MGISCDSRHLYESNWTLHSSITCVSKKKYEARTDERHTAWINLLMPSLRVDTERDFFPVVSSFHHALVKTSYQPSFSSANFLPFTSAEAL